MLDQPASASLNTVSDESSAPVGLFDQALASAREFTVVARDHLDVFVVEVRQAAVNLALVIGAGIVMAVLVVFAWSTLMDAATVWLISAGVSPPMAFLWVGLANLIGAGLAYTVGRVARRKVALNATRRLLTPTPAPPR